MNEFEKKIKTYKEESQRRSFMRNIFGKLESLNNSIKSIPKYPKTIKVSNFPEQIKDIKVTNFPKQKDSFNVKNIGDIKFPSHFNVKNADWVKYEEIEKEFNELRKAITGQNLDKYTSVKNPLAVKLVSARQGGGFYDALGGGGGNMGKPQDGRTKIVDSSGKVWELEENGAMPVNIQDQHTDTIDIKFSQLTNTTTISANASTGDRTLTITDTTGFVDGKQLAILSSEGVIIVQQIGVPSGNVITIDTPLPNDVLAGTTIRSSIINMAVNGSVTPQSFKIGPVGPTSVDITRILGYIQSSESMTDDTFGGLAALTNGVVFRIYDSSTGKFNNKWNVKYNGEIGLLCFDATLVSSSLPVGTFGFRFRNTYAGQDKHGVTLRLEQGDYLEILIQDNLTGLDIFNIVAQGHLITD